MNKDKVLVLCPECSVSLRLPDNKVGYVNCPRCESRVFLDTSRKKSPSYILLAALGLLWAIVATQLTGSPASPTVLFLLSLAILSTLLVARKFWAHKLIDLSMIVNGIWLFGIMAACCFPFFLANITLKYDDLSPFRGVTLSTLIRVQQGIRQYLPGATIELSGALVAIFFALVAVVFLIKNSLNYARFYAKLSQRTVVIVGIANTIAMCILSFSIVSITAGTSLVKTTEREISKQIDELLENVNKLEAQVLAVHGDRLVATVLEASPVTDGRLNELNASCENMNIDPSDCSLNSLSDILYSLDTEGSSRNQSSGKNIGEGGDWSAGPNYPGPSRPDGGGGIHDRDRITRNYGSRSNNDIVNAGKVFCSFYRCEKIRSNDVQVAFSEVVSSIMDAALLGVGPFIPTGVISELGGGLIRKIVDDIATDPVKDSLIESAQAYTENFVGRCGYSSNCNKPDAVTFPEYELSNANINNANAIATILDDRIDDASKEQERRELALKEEARIEKARKQQERRGLALKEEARIEKVRKDKERKERTRYPIMVDIDNWPSGTTNNPKSVLGIQKVQCYCLGRFVGWRLPSNCSGPCR